MSAVMTCVRHPTAETRLRCSACEEAICPRCAVPSAVGQKCPGCARQAASALARGRPRQVVKGVAAGTVAAGALAWALALLLSSVGMFPVLASGFGGYGVGRAVRWGAEGNAAERFRYLAVVLAVAAIAAAWWLVGALLPGGWGLLTYPAAAYGAYVVFR